ncbi:MAG: D-2-hydroxyacid dehydrogenase [Lachnospiraceae bacterium]|nr:D-2-hydroxyacid dehydrogenase [Lachnospiraceae bacterium]
MSTIAIIKKCLVNERDFVLSHIDSDDKVLFFDDEKQLLSSDTLDSIEIVLGEPDIDTVLAMKKLKWLQMTWAGANKYTTSPELFENIILTSASGAYGDVISEYIISGVLALYRNLFLYRGQLKDGGWNRIDKEGTLEGKRALILGTGNIGTETARRLKVFGTEAIGICRTNKDSIPCFDAVYTNEYLDREIEKADIVIIALPGTKETADMFNKNRIAKLKPDSILVNVGRGIIVDTDALTDALANNRIQGAVLDVTNPEPLPDNHPLRFMENVVLTPHISGIGWGENKYTRMKILDIFCDNLKKYRDGEVLNNVIDFNKGY